ncbi:hypothetical protein REPUB_Repub06bG0133100 [Reevesia pubescens]
MTKVKNNEAIKPDQQREMSMAKQFGVLGVTPSSVNFNGCSWAWFDVVMNQFSNIDEADWVMDWMSKLWKLGTIGPSLPSMRLDGRLEDGNRRRPSYQPTSEESSRKDLAVTWCPQLKMLAYESVGCFVSHCGFNSVLEAEFGSPHGVNASMDRPIHQRQICREYLGARHNRCHEKRGHSAVHKRTDGRKKRVKNYLTDT